MCGRCQQKHQAQGNPEREVHIVECCEAQKPNRAKSYKRNQKDNEGNHNGEHLVVEGYILLLARCTILNSLCKPVKQLGAVNLA